MGDCIGGWFVGGWRRRTLRGKGEWFGGGTVGLRRQDAVADVVSVVSDWEWVGGWVGGLKGKEEGSLLFLSFSIPLLLLLQTSNHRPTHPPIYLPNGAGEEDGFLGDYGAVPAEIGEVVFLHVFPIDLGGWVDGWLRRWRRTRRFE